MNRQGHENAKFFIGAEVEHTPALNKKTLFVVGVPRPEEIFAAAEEHKVANIYLGANQSFNLSKIEQFAHLLDRLIQQGFTVTLDFKVADYAEVVGQLPQAVLNSRFFIPMISVALPGVELLNSNATLKIDDRDFAATNTGVWCHSVESLLDNNRFTPWVEYEADDVVAANHSKSITSTTTAAPAEKSVANAPPKSKIEYAAVSKERAKSADKEEATKPVKVKTEDVKTQPTVESAPPGAVEQLVEVNKPSTSNATAQPKQKQVDAAAVSTESK